MNTYNNGRHQGLNTGFYGWILFMYGSYVLSLLKDWSSLTEQLAIALNQKVFMLRCRKRKILPRHLQKSNICNGRKFRNFNIKQTFIQLNQNIKWKLLNMEISDIHCHIKLIKSKRRFLIHKITNKLPFQCFSKFFHFDNLKFNRIFNIQRERLRNKFEFLLNRQTEKVDNENIIINENWFKNLTEVQISDEIVKIVALGPKHAFPIQNRKEIPIEHFIAGIENGISIYRDNVDYQNEIRSDCSCVLNTFKNRIDTTGQKNFNKANNKVIKKFLNENTDVFFTKADKGNTTVAMSLISYIHSMKQILSDSSTYMISKFEYTATLTSNLNKIITNWQKLKYIDDKQTKQLKIHKAVIPRAYGLPKIHKPGNPLRIIVSTIDAPTYNMAQFLALILHNVYGRTHTHIKDSWKFVEKIKHINLPENYKLISLDVVSMYTNLSFDMILNSVEKKWNLIKTFTKIPKEEFFNALKLIMNSTYFKFDNLTYKQKFGLPMGSPLSPILANITLEYVENLCIKDLPFEIPFFFRYVDDILTAIPENCEDLVLELFNNFDRINNRLQFTLEKEDNSKINFLDVTLTRKSNGKILTNWYHKKTWSGRYLNFSSQHPMSQKIGMIYSLIDRAVKLSDVQFRQQNLELVKTILKNNGYPDELITQSIDKRIHRIYNCGFNNSNSRQNERFVSTTSIPYIKGVTEKISKILKKAKVRVVNKPINTNIGRIKPQKDVLEKGKLSNVVYKIPCRHCPASYIGQTGRCLETRLKEHKKNISLPVEKHSGLSRHRVETGHDFDYDNVIILENERNWRRRGELENFHIKKQKNTVNIRFEESKLPQIYNIFTK